MTRTALTLGAGLLALPVIVAVLVAGLLTAIPPAARPAASAAALADIPPDYLLLYQQAATDCPGLDWTLLAAIGKIESDHGRSPAARRHPRPEPRRRGRADAVPAAHLRRRPRPPPATRRAGRHRRRGTTRTTPSTPPPTTSATTTPPPTRTPRCSPTTTPTPTSPPCSPKPPTYRQTAPLRTAWPPQRADVPDPSGTGGYVTARTAGLYRALAASGATREGATCWDPHLQNPDSDHPRGKACDLFFRPHDPTDIARGWTVAHWLTAHQADYGVHYLIWQGLHLDRRAPHLDDLPIHDLRLPEPGQPHRLPLRPHTFLGILKVTIIPSDARFAPLGLGPFT